LFSNIHNNDPGINAEAEIVQEDPPVDFADVYAGQLPGEDGGDSPFQVQRNS
jgi:hypothetical protein